MSADGGITRRLELSDHVKYGGRKPGSECLKNVEMSFDDRLAPHLVSIKTGILINMG